MTAQYCGPTRGADASPKFGAGFLGDYMWVDTDRQGDAHIVWADTRPIRGTAPEEDIYYAEVRRDHGH